ncbi:MAG: hypothetical protein K6B70_03105 [Clostridia bacterium]|nr:hypothetical protein [Clostridia bacterium]
MYGRKNSNCENVNIENNQNVDSNKNKPKKKGKGLKILVIIIIIVMAVIIGVLSWLLISGKNFSDIFNKNNQGQLDNKGQNVVSTDNGNGNATGKGGDGEDPAKNTNLKDSFSSKTDTTSTQSTTKAQNSKQGTFTNDQLKTMALDYYEAKTGYRPNSVALQVNADDSISIQLYDNMGDHNSTSDWYTVDKDTVVGTDIMGNKIDLKEKPARQK